MFTLDKEKDAWAHKMIADAPSDIWGDKIESLKNNDYLITMPFIAKYLEAYLQKNADIIFGRFNLLTKLNIHLDDLGYFLNTTPVSLHNGKDSFVSIGLHHSFASYPTVLIHEIFHVYFYHFLRSDSFLKKLSPSEENEIKEIITVIINVLFQDIIDLPDDGYPNHQEIRKAALSAWGSEKDVEFSSWVSEVLNMYKRLFS